MTRQELGDGRFQCLSPVVVNAVPPGIHGNQGPGSIAINGCCGRVYDLSDEQAAYAARAAKAALRAAAEAAERRVREEEEALDNDPRTPGRIRELASALIQSRPSGSVAVVVEVEIPSRLPGLRSRFAHAEVDRAWPVGRCTWSGSSLHTSMSHATGITRAGEPVMLIARAPSVRLEPRYKWKHPNHGHHILTGYRDHPTEGPWRESPWRVQVVRQLVADTERGPTSAETADVAPAAKLGKPLSN